MGLNIFIDHARVEGMIKNRNGKVVIPAGRIPWSHELRVANILAMAGHDVEFLLESNIKTADILLDGIEYEIKSPFTNKPRKLERNIKRGLEQSKNIIFDSYRVKNMSDENLRRFLTNKMKEQRQIGNMIFITKKGCIIDIKTLV